jgi:hypothetical protein
VGKEGLGTGINKGKAFRSQFVIYLQVKNKNKNKNQVSGFFFISLFFAISDKLQFRLALKLNFNIKPCTSYVVVLTINLHSKFCNIFL